VNISVCSFLRYFLSWLYARYFRATFHIPIFPYFPYFPSGVNRWIIKIGFYRGHGCQVELDPLNDPISVRRIAKNSSCRWHRDQKNRRMNLIVVTDLASRLYFARPCVIRMTNVFSRFLCWSIFIFAGIILNPRLFSSKFDLSGCVCRFFMFF